MKKFLFLLLPLFLFADVDTFFSEVKLRGDSKNGFNETELVETIRELPPFVDLIGELTRNGYRYGGDTKDTSKAYTDLALKRVCIGKNTTSDEACLSLMYELTNAQNSPRLQVVQDEYLYDTILTQARALAYAHAILLIEADAVYNRSLIAIKLGLTSLVKNQKYLSIVESYPKAAAIRAIHQEMITNGRVHNGLKKAVDHYIDQYFFESANGLMK